MNFKNCFCVVFEDSGTLFSMQLKRKRSIFIIKETLHFKITIVQLYSLNAKMMNSFLFFNLKIDNCVKSCRNTETCQTKKRIIFIIETIVSSFFDPE